MLQYILHLGDCRDVLATMGDNSIDAIVCDPPYELGFMGKTWDASGIAYDVTVWTHCLRVLKPGGHLIAFGGSRTYHRLAVAIEDAGFVIRDQIQWIYGSGFPKSLDVSKAMDKQAGAVRDVVGEYSISGMSPDRVNFGANDRSGGKGMGFRPGDIPITAPATDLAKQWHGWGTALKPAHEPAVLARKPLRGTVADTVAQWGTGALNIEGTRITDAGRWPANVILDEEAASLLGEPSRFFYVAKASKAEREAGLDAADGERANHHPTVKPLALMRYLVRMVTPPGGVVLDPFMGSGSTGCAALAEGFDFVGIDIIPEYVSIAEKRIDYYSK